MPYQLQTADAKSTPVDDWPMLLATIKFLKVRDEAGKHVGSRMDSQGFDQNAVWKA